MSTPDLSERYGAPSPWRRRVVAGLGALVVVLAAGWLVWALQDQTSPQITSEMPTWSIDGEHAATATVVVSTAAPDLGASCTLRAFAEDHSVVGELRFDPADQPRRTQTLAIRTERRATAIELLGCTAPGQNRPR